MSRAKVSIWHFSSLDSILALKNQSETTLRGKPEFVSGSIRPSDDLEKWVELRDGSIGAHENEYGCFNSRWAEYAFCFSLAASQFLAEYLISGFGIILPNLPASWSHGDSRTSNLWPSSILSLVLCSMTLPLSRATDMYGGYPLFMLGTAWLSIWTLAGGFCQSQEMLNVARAMQGLAIAAFQPAAFSLLARAFRPGRKRNVVFGVYGACAPLGFFGGILTSGICLQFGRWEWYFWVGSVLALLSAISAYFAVPETKIKPPAGSKDLKMDWIGACAIASGLIMLSYGLAASAASEVPWKDPAVLGPLCAGALCLVVSLYVELNVVDSPLLPTDFFAPKNVKAMLVACLMFYGSFGSYLFYSMSYINDELQVKPITMAVWYSPMAIGGFIISIVGGLLCDVVPAFYLLLVSGLAWIGAPLLLAIGSNVTTSYWPFIFPSTICSTLGIDLTFTVSAIFLASVQPDKFQGLAGAVSSVTVNLGIAVAVSLSDIARRIGTEKFYTSVASYQVVFWFATLLAGIGFAITLLFVRIKRLGKDQI
ncbi:putative MFS multidrug transporter [Eremomyces bilateralis CBS 781.70]|uniref:MFS multidrug transporter n=1 Tax=Eremomyces bilateralis CBS 781.70 TaxID=1392243 RepID=A0A6G1GEX8_9PEZI|nr:putative MFS multidrug transporter [Eremomyces bilateralis CBS 781.70]KAF1816584.1 putative MFS multidrug transporter [Eremomyces bilateralis CBS 781.70]